MTDGSLKKDLEDEFDTQIKQFFNNGYLDSTKLKGVIDAQQSQMKSSKGNVLFDSDGIWLMDGTTKASTTKAVWMNESGILFGTGSRVSDPGSSNLWTWTTAINHNGIVAEAIAAGKVSGLELYGGEIHIGPKSSGGYYFNVDSNGNVAAETGTFKGTVQASKYLDQSGNNMLSKESGKFDAEYLNLKGLNINNRFIVDENGNVTINNGSISWGAVTGTTEIDNRIASAQSTANNAQSTANSAQSTASTAETIAKQIASGEYRGTFINGTTVASPTISGGVIAGGEFTNASQGAYLKMDGGAFGDLRLYSRTSSGTTSEKFRIYDGGAEVSLGLAGKTVMTYNPISNTLVFQVPVVGITATFG